MFFFKRKKIVVDCFVADEVIAKSTPIQSVKNFVPSWFKNTPLEFTANGKQHSTIKRCMGIIEYYKTGVILPAWTDIDIKLNKNINGEVNISADFFSPFRENGQHHSSPQWDKFANPDEFTHFKLLSPWHLQCKEDVEFFWTSPFWNYDLGKDDFYIPPGVLDYKYNNSTNVNLFLNLKTEKIQIRHNDPLVHIIPLTEKDVEFKIQLITENEYNSKFTGAKCRLNAYARTRNAIMKNEKKCPFNF